MKNGVHYSSSAFIPMLTGQELVAFVKANGEMDQVELARETGYTRLAANGKERIMSKQLYQALLEAKGVTIKGGRRPGKAAQFETTVHKNGVILIGRTYSQKFGVEPGDVLDIVISEDEIRLVPQGSAPLTAVKGSVRVG
jgi:hypothetical protein